MLCNCLIRPLLCFVVMSGNIEGVMSTQVDEVNDGCGFQAEHVWRQKMVNAID